ncbi:MAG: VacJ family lipoprotein [Methylococcales bacterium]|nr:VacJ family lipoprotein [Methylococcales bacterium]
MSKKINLFVCIIFSTVLLNGCASTQIKNLNDPWEGWNRPVHSFNDKLDGYVFKPGAKIYRWVTPKFVDRSITNVFSNINDIGVTINDVLQGKFLQSGLDFSRFLVNSTAGLGGLIDVASMVDLPKHEEDFGQTLGVWGVPTGPYLVLPFFGPSSPRGASGLVGDAALNPTSYIGFFVSYVSTGLFVIDTVDKRADNLGTEKTADEAAVFGRYEFFRDAYIAKRRSLMLDGNVPEEEDLLLDLDDDFDELDENL